jgi:putative ABC transport system ATP-binding protein
MTDGRGNGSEPLISLRDVHKEYRRDAFVVPVLAGITLDVKPGEFLALMGPSGSGKSTLLNLIGGIDRPTKGEIRVAGESLNALNPGKLAAWRARHVGFIFQLYNLIPVLTAYRNIELPLLLTRLGAADRKKRVELALSLVGLEGRNGHYPRQLSGGEEQRVAIARAVVADPTLIVADEPTGDLDRVSAADILAMMQRLNRELGKTIIMVTHDLNAAKAAKTIVHLEKGELLVPA